MKLSKRVSDISESMTLKLNAKAVQLTNEGRKIFNLTAGQLPFRPMSDFIDGIKSESDFLKSYQYSPVPGYPELRSKLLSYFEKSRGVNLENSQYDCIVGNGGKHVISNILASIIDPEDEVVVITPFWVSYPEMINLYGGQTVFVETSIYDAFVPNIEAIEKSITDKTKAIILNSPNNPTGTNYSAEWMNQFAELLKRHPDVYVISDEIYYELSFFDPGPTYFYQQHPELLERTIVVDGISKNLACTGLRIGYCYGPKELISAMSRLQGQTASGANSLVQKALLSFDFSNIERFLEPIKQHLRENANLLRDCLHDQSLGKIWYQPNSAFYYMIDFSQCPVMERFKKSSDESEDYSIQICEEILDKLGVAMVPGIAFGLPNSARISLVSQKEDFREAMQLVVDYLTQS